MQPHRQPRAHDEACESQGMSSPAHILLHQSHRGRRLDVQPAAVETYALADHGQTRVGRIAPAHFDHARRKILASGAPDGVDHRKALFQHIAPRHGHAGVKFFRNRAYGILQLRRAHVSGRRIHQVADQRDRLREPDLLVDFRHFFGQQDAGANRGVILAVAVKTILRRHPAQRGRASMALRESIMAFRQYLRQLGEAPGGKVRLVRYARDHRPIPRSLARNDRMFIAFAAELLGRDNRPYAIGLRPEPWFKASRVHDLHHMRGLIVVRFEQFGKFGHVHDSEQWQPCWKAQFSSLVRLIPAGRPLLNGLAGLD